MGSGSSLPYEIISGSENIFPYNKQCTIQNGTHKETGTQVSIFTYKLPNTYAQNSLKRCKTIRHPFVIKYIDSIENNEFMYIVTERLIPFDNKIDIKTDQLLLSLYLYQLGTALQFISNSCHLVHYNIRPSSLYFSSDGILKIGGFEYSFDNNSTDLPPIDYDNIFLPHNEDFNPKFPYSIDIYSLAVNIWMMCNGNTKLTNRNQLYNNTENIPQKIIITYKKMISQKASNRISFADFLTCNFFKNNQILETVNFFDNFTKKSENEITSFINGSFFINNMKSIAVINNKIISKYIIQLLLKVILLNTSSNSIKLLDYVFEIGNTSFSDHKEEYKNLLLPSIISLFNINERTIRLALFRNLPHFISFFSGNDLINKLFDISKPSIVTGFTDVSPLLREQTMKSMLYFVPVLPDNIINAQILPYLASLQSDPESGIRTNTCILLSKLCNSFSAEVRHKVIPGAFIKAIHDNCLTTKVAGIMSINTTIQYYENVDLISRILPLLLPLLLNNNIDLKVISCKACVLIMNKINKVIETAKANSQPTGLLESFNNPKNNTTNINDKKSSKNNNVTNQKVDAILFSKNSNEDKSNLNSDNNGWNDFFSDFENNDNNDNNDNNINTLLSTKKDQNQKIHAAINPNSNSEFNWNDIQTLNNTKIISNTINSISKIQPLDKMITKDKNPKQVDLFEGLLSNTTTTSTTNNDDLFSFDNFKISTNTSNNKIKSVQNKPNTDTKHINDTNNKKIVNSDQWDDFFDDFK